MAVIERKWHANDYQPTGSGCIGTMTVPTGCIYARMLCSVWRSCLTRKSSLNTCAFGFRLRFPWLILSDAGTAAFEKLLLAKASKIPPNWDGMEIRQWVMDCAKEAWVSKMVKTRMHRYQMAKQIYGL